MLLPNAFEHAQYAFSLTGAHALFEHYERHARPGKVARSKTHALIFPKGVPAASLEPLFYAHAYTM